jgi:hypothetical protein
VATFAPDCAAIARVEREPLLGTASRVRGWLLLEHPHAWGHNALTESDLDPGLAGALKAASARHGVRVLLIRRGADVSDEGPAVYAAHSGMEGQWLRRLPLGRPSELLDLDLDAISAGEGFVVGAEETAPLFLVCTNEARDPCCETYGRPVVERLGGTRPTRTWESSHVGGDRFAANLVCLPLGLYFGRLDPGDVVRVADLCERGVIDLEHYRGRSCYEPVVQAADILVRRRTGSTGIHDLVPEWRRDHGGGQSTIRFRDRQDRIQEVRVAVRRGRRRRLTCNSTHPGAPREFAEVTGAG